MTPVQKNIYQYLLSADGVNQTLRVQPALDPDTVKIDGRSMSELIRFMNAMAQQVKYFDFNKNPQGDWSAFFSFLKNGSEILTDAQLEALLSIKKDLSPHVALLLAYLKIYSVAKDDMNALVKRRLDYYYEEVLQLKRRPANADRVHVKLELAKNAVPYLIKAGTLLDGGKTNKGLPLHYAIENDVVISNAAISAIRSSFQDFNTNGKGMVFRSNDATLVKNDTGTAWRPLGSAQLALSSDARAMEPVSFGWSFASPNLFLAEGKRRIIITVHMLSLRGHKFDEYPVSPFIIPSITSDKKWLSEELSIKAVIKPGIPFISQDIALENPFTLELTIDINEAAPAITAYSEKVHKAMYNTRWPVLQLLLKPDSFLLETLSIFKISSIDMEVQVQGVKDLILQNDLALQPANKPSLPFGPQPVVGANFYIGSKEVFGKSLKSLNVKLEWQDPPADFADYYAAYDVSAQLTNNKFIAALDVRQNRNWNLRLLPNFSLFNSVDTSQVKEFEVINSLFQTLTQNSPYQRDPELELPDEFSPNVQQGFARLVLTGPTAFTSGNLPAEAPFEAFGHKTFSVAYTQKVIELSQWDGNGIKPELPKPAYTPTLKTVTVDYTAKDTFRPDDPNGIDQYFINDIFGPGETKKDDTVLLLAPKPIKGAMYIGLEKASAPQSVSFLLQVEEGNVESATLLRSSDITWSYLAGNRWRDIPPADVIEDSTGGLQKPGLIRVNMGADATTDHTMMTPGLHWLRASVKDNPGGAASIADIVAQAAKGLLVLPETGSAGYEEHLATPLPANTVGKLLKKIPSIKKVTQPYPSIGGRNPESDDSFYRRVSERLRHKNRAVTSWDYERLLLENFPEIYKVKTLPHSDTELSFKPGDVRLVVVPDWRKRPTGDPLQPKTNPNRLREMDDFISGTHTSPLARVHVTNPAYETLLVDCKVNFHPQFDPGYYAAVLNEDLKKFLSPWAFEEGQDIVFGGKVYASEILAFIEGKEYVDFVTDFELYHRYNGNAGGGISDMQINLDFIIGYTPEPSIAKLDTSIAPAIEVGGKTIGVDFVIGEPVQVAAATRPDSILVSNINHRIEAVQADGTNCQGIQQIGIGQMIVGLDFIPI